MAYRILALLLVLCVGSSAWAIAPAHWQVCDGGQADKCRTVIPEYVRLRAPLTTFSTVVRLPSDTIGEPIAVEIDAMASAAVRWNGVVIGTNGLPGASREREVPGRYSVSLPVPPALVHPGDNRVSILLSAQHLWLPVDQPIHRIAIGPRHDAAAYTLRHYLPTLGTLALPAGALLVLAALLIAGRIGRAVLPAMAMLAAIVTQGFIEISKIVVSYTYPWHLARLVSLTGLTAIVGLLVVWIASRLFMRARARIVVAVTSMAMSAACLLVSGPDRQSLAVFQIAMLAAAVLATPTAVRRDRRAILLVPIAVALGVWAHIVGPDFLDTGYYVSGAAAAVALGVAAILQPAPIRDASVTTPAVEPTVTLRDGAHHHVIAPSQLVFLRADDDYCSLHMADGREVVVTMTLKGVLALLSSDFIRIHRSHAINIRHLHGTKAGPNGRLAEMFGGIFLPVGRAYASELRSAMDEGVAEVRSELRAVIPQHR